MEPQDQNQIADQAQPSAGTVQGWRPIETAPKDGRTLLLGHFNLNSKWRTLRGQWFSQGVIDEQWEDPDTCSEGWYETSVECDDEVNAWKTQPTHWRPLPAPPLERSGPTPPPDEQAPQALQRTPLTDSEIAALLEASDWPAAMLSGFVSRKLRVFARAIERAHGIRTPKE